VTEIRGYFFCLFLSYVEHPELALTLPETVVLVNLGNPLPAIHCNEPFKENNFGFRCVTWASKDLFTLKEYPEKR